MMKNSVEDLQLKFLLSGKDIHDLKILYNSQQKKWNKKKFLKEKFQYNCRMSAHNLKHLFGM